jgi:hypothetical protein
VLSLSERKGKTDILGLANFGIFLIVVGIIVATTPNLVDRFADFFSDFHMQEVASNVFLPIPGLDHPVVFNAIFWFCLIFGILQIVVLAGRFIMKDTVRRTASTAMGIIFWLGAAWSVTLLIAKSITWWPTFAGYIIALCGIAIVAENIIVIAIRRD